MRDATVPDLLRRTLRRHGSRPALRTHLGGVHRTLLYEALGRRVERLARGLMELGVEAGDPVALWSAPGPRWTVADLAILHAGGVPTLLHEAARREEAHELLEASGASILLVDEARAADARALTHDLGARGTIVVLDLDAARDPAVLPLAEVLAMGDDQASLHPGGLAERWQSLGPDDPAGLVPTEGRRGRPRLVPVTHRNLVSGVGAFLDAVPLGPDDTVLAPLPPSLAFQRLVGHLAPLTAGATVVHGRGPRSLLADLGETTPTVLAGSPRLLELLRAELLATPDAPGAPRAMGRALAAGRRVVEARRAGGEASSALATEHRVGDRRNLAPLRTHLGDRLRLLLVGGDPLDPGVEAFHRALGLDVLQTYSLAEAPVAAVARPGTGTPGSVGTPLRGMELRLEADGEILLRGPPVADGVPSSAGGSPWLRTGDGGRFDDEGNLHVQGPLVDVLELAGGARVPPARLETALALASPLLAAAVVEGDGRRHPGALLVPDVDAVQAWARERDLHPGRYEDLRDLPGLRSVVAQAVAAVNADLPEDERVERFEILPRALRRDEGELTPSGRVRRDVVVERFANLAAGLHPAD